MKAIIAMFACLWVVAAATVTKAALAGPTLSVSPSTIVVPGGSGSITGSGYDYNGLSDIYYFFYSDSCHDTGTCSYVAYSGPEACNSSGHISDTFTACPTNNTYYWLYTYDYGQDAWSNNDVGVRIYCEYLQ